MSVDQKDQSIQDDGKLADDQKPDLELNRTAEEYAKRLRETSDEAKKYRQANAELKAKLDSQEKERLESQGKFQELAQKEKERADGLEKSSREKEAKFALRAVKTQLKAEASKLGCVDADALIQLIDLSALKVNEDDYEVEPQSMKSVLEAMQKEKSYLFQKQASHAKDLPPGGSKDLLKNKSLNEMTLAEKLALLNGKQHA